MDVVIRFASYAPPEGTVEALDGEPLPFAGRLGLLRALDSVVARSAAVEAGREPAPSGPDPDVLPPG